MQNIPSHAKDIRHMFRATPEYDLTFDCNESLDDIDVILPRWYKVTTVNGDVDVGDIQPNDIVEIIDNTQTSSWHRVKQIQPISITDLQIILEKLPIGEEE